MIGAVTLLVFVYFSIDVNGAKLSHVVIVVRWWSPFVILANWANGVVHMPHEMGGIPLRDDGSKCTAAAIGIASSSTNVGSAVRRSRCLMFRNNRWVICMLQRNSTLTNLSALEHCALNALWTL